MVLIYTGIVLFALGLILSFTIFVLTAISVFRVFDGDGDTGGIAKRYTSYLIPTALGGLLVAGGIACITIHFILKHA